MLLRESYDPKWVEAKWNSRHQDKVEKKTNKKKKNTGLRGNLGDNSNSVKACRILTQLVLSSPMQVIRVRLFTTSEDPMTPYIHIYKHIKKSLSTPFLKKIKTEMLRKRQTQKLKEPEQPEKTRFVTKPEVTKTSKIYKM